MTIQGNVRGKNFSLAHGTIKFFGDQGCINSPTDWSLSFIPGGGIAHTDPLDTMAEIRVLIMGDVNNGQGDNIAVLVVTPLYGVRLVLEGVITAQHLHEAQEPTNDIVDIPGVFIEGRTLTVRVLNGAQHTMATADAQGHFIP